jgi:uncharacterized protein YdaU (DUF1376 family)
MHYYQFNIADYRKDTVHLSLVEHAIYRELIDQYHLDESPIPLETQSVIRRLRLASESDISAFNNVLSDFFCKRADGWHHKRVDQDIVEYRAMAAKNKANGKLGGRPKKTQSVSTGNPLVTQTKGNQEPITNNQEPEKTNTTPRASRFDAAASLSSLGVDDQIAKDWLQHRKAKRAAVTQTVIDGIRREAATARIALSDALSISCQRGWTGFKADWVAEQQRGIASKQTKQDRDRDFMAALTGRRPAVVKDALTGSVIEGEIL